MRDLTDTQRAVLAAAADREDRSVLPLPDSIRTNRPAADRVVASLLKRALIAERPASGDGDTWRAAADGQAVALFVTDAGLRALANEPEPGAAEATLDDGGETAGAGSSGEPDDAGPSAFGGARAPAARRRPRPGTKKALLVELLKRADGATIQEIAEATGWRAHTVRGAISGAIKKKLGFTVVAEFEGRGRVYRIVGHDTEMRSLSQ